MPTSLMSAETLFAGLPEPALLIAPYQDRIVFANSSMSRLLDSSRSELQQLAMSALVGDQLPELIAFTEQLFSQGNAWNAELILQAPKGSRHAVEITGAQLLAENGDELVLLLCRDLHTQKQRWTQQELDQVQRGGLLEWQRIELLFQDIERENQLILRAAGEGIYGVDADGKTTFLNPAGERMLGWRAEEVAGTVIHNLIHHRHPDGSCYPLHHCPIYAAFQDGKVHHVDHEYFWRKDGTCFAVEYTSTPIVDQGQLIGAVVVFRDISARIEAEQRLKDALTQVEALKQRLEMENAYLQEELSSEHHFHDIVGRSEAIKTIIRRIELVAPTHANVLITGESGTGKELIARAIHQASERCHRPLIRVNCAAIPSELFESEFFGHIKGAFTGASQDRIGRFELADGGTLFLDEVGEIPLDLQGKLLRVLQDQHFERVGDTHTRRVDVRVIAATNRDLTQEIQARRFREDLYFRLNVFPIESPPLRARRDDIPLLAQAFLDRACQQLKQPARTLRQSDIDNLMQYDWPGNIRELENIIERQVIVSAGQRLRFDLPQSTVLLASSTAEQPDAPDPVLTETERHQRDLQNTLAALTQCQGRVFGPQGAAALLGVKPTTLASRLKKWQVDPRDFKPSQTLHQTET